MKYKINNLPLSQKFYQNKFSGLYTAQCQECQAIVTVQGKLDTVLFKAFYHNHDETNRKWADMSDQSTSGWYEISIPDEVQKAIADLSNEI